VSYDAWYSCAAFKGYFFDKAVANATPKMNSGRRMELSPFSSRCQHCHGLKCVCGQTASSVELQKNQQMPLVRQWAIHRVQAEPYFKLDPILVTFPTAHSPTSASPRRPKSQQSSRTKKTKQEDDFNMRRAAADTFFRDLSGIDRSACVQESFHHLRRAAWEHKDDEEGPDESLTNATLRDTEDSTATLSKVLARLDALKDPVLMAGSTRHATAIVSCRALQVVQRKRDLIQSCEERIAAFEKLQLRREEILEAVVEGQDPPQDLLRLDKFMTSKTHKGGLNPADDNKSDFQAFAQSFGMPSGHQCFRRLKLLGTDATLWWARRALKLATGNADADATIVHRLLQLSANIMGKSQNPYIVEARKALGNAIAENVLRSCQALQRKDKALVQRMKKAQPESARQCAELINSQIKIAVSIGASPKHPALAKAKHLAAEMFMEERNRLALRVLEQAWARKETQDQETDKHAGVPPIGPAAEAAEQVHKEVKHVIDNGVPPSHPSLEEALRIAKELLDLDAMRKRLAAREKRMSRR